MMKMTPIVYLIALITVCTATVPLEEEGKSATAVSLCGDENNDGNVNDEEMALFFSKNYKHFISNDLIPNAGGIPDFVFKHIFSHDKNLDSKVSHEESKAHALVHTKAMDNCYEIQELTKSLTEHPYTTQEAQAMSNCIDVNKNGILSREEFVNFFGMQELTQEIDGVNGLDEFIARMMVKYDGNNDGTVTDSEFQAVVLVYFQMINLCGKK